MINHLHDHQLVLVEKSILIFMEVLETIIKLKLVNQRFSVSYTSLYMEIIYISVSFLSLL